MDASLHFLFLCIQKLLYRFIRKELFKSFTKMVKNKSLIEIRMRSSIYKFQMKFNNFLPSSMVVATTELDAGPIPCLLYGVTEI